MAQVKTSRILELDATRGAAMLGVLLSHAAAFTVDGSGKTASLLINVGLVATPTFLLLSGVVCAYLHATARDVERLRARLLDRALFLLIVAHLILSLTHMIWEPAPIALGRNFFVTDAVGVCLILAAIVGRLATRNQLLCAGGALLIVSWAIAFSLEPSTRAAQLAMRFLVGLTTASGTDGYIVPILPYLGLFLIGMGAGVEYSMRRAAGMPVRTIALFSLTAGVTFIVSVCIFKLCSLLITPFVSPGVHLIVHHLADPRTKLPPGPAYVFGFGGAGLVMAGIIGMVAEGPRGRAAIEALAVVGRASLFVYILQYWLTYVPASGFHQHGGTLFTATALFGAVLGCWAAAWLWDRANGNRLLTLGLRSSFVRPTYLTDSRMGAANSGAEAG